MYQSLESYKPTASSKLISLGFTSEATENLGLMGIMRLFFQCCINNRESEITGMLYYDGKYFAQIIEGSDLNVNLLWNAIENDGRHKQIKIFGKNIISSRVFSSWSMRVKDGAAIALICPELKDLIDEIDCAESAPKIAQSMYVSARVITQTASLSTALPIFH